MHPPQIIAHRSRFGKAENCVEALAALPDFVAGAEIDVRLSADGAPVLIHDDNASRTTGTDAEIAQQPFAQIAKLRQPGDIEIPSLNAYLQKAADCNISTLLVDLKKPNRATIHVVQAALAESGLADRCILLARSIGALKRIREAGVQYRIGLFGVTIDNVHQRLEASAELNLELMCIKPGNTRYLENRPAVKSVHDAGLRVGASAIYRPEVLEAAVADGCDYILTHAFDKLPQSVRGTSAPL
ncbi:glycerophosphodiester phosphodiesterase [Natronoglycomyces albus]|uniref:GP-PDE domain-containing protein n=1 Tax=Natronoglycomyces albus TaxID=2811108 RepID=A0A895XHP5_9ACTN|nr:glycerophosphodiester phosphodiesterase family protein [Natronoglycomyces albus]QSB04457.1 hypothetical protein JQS30_11765 [Natronoglycomyces albus]